MVDGRTPSQSEDASFLASGRLAGCPEHGREQIRGYCKDCNQGVCFRCAIGKHRTHTMVDIEEVTNDDLCPMLEQFDQKI